MQQNFFEGCTIENVYIIYNYHGGKIMEGMSYQEMEEILSEGTEKLFFISKALESMSRDVDGISENDSVIIAHMIGEISDKITKVLDDVKEQMRQETPTTAPESEAVGA